jgi:hypothetical protein
LAELLVCSYGYWWFALVEQWLFADEDFDDSATLQTHNLFYLTNDLNYEIKQLIEDVRLFLPIVSDTISDAQCGFESMG